MTHHAQARWSERFSHLDLTEVWTKAGRVGKKTMAAIRAACPAHVDVTTREFKGFYYRISRFYSMTSKEHSQIVFVVTPPETIITVFPLCKPSPNE